MDWTNLETFSFGDGPRLADELLGLMLEGRKRATCWAVDEGMKGVEVGKCMVALDGGPGARAPLRKPSS
jgi:uncharacterized protein YhfF